MSHRSLLLSLLIAPPALLLMAACTGPTSSEALPAEAEPVTESTEDAPSDEPEVELLFVQNASGGRVTDGDPTADGWFTIELVVADQTLYFSDRPDRIAGHMTTGEYAERFETYFADSSPNAVLEITDGPVVRATALELGSATYDATAGTLTYAARNITSPTIGHQTPVDEYGPVPVEFGRSALFIDDATEASTALDQEPRNEIIDVGEFSARNMESWEHTASRSPWVRVLRLNMSGSMVDVSVSPSDGALICELATDRSLSGPGPYPTSNLSRAEPEGCRSGPSAGPLSFFTSLGLNDFDPFANVRYVAVYRPAEGAWGELDPYSVTFTFRDTTRTVVFPVVAQTTGAGHEIPRTSDG